MLPFSQGECSLDPLKKLVVEIIIFEYIRIPRNIFRMMTSNLPGVFFLISINQRGPPLK